MHELTLRGSMSQARKAASSFLHLACVQREREVPSGQIPTLRCQINSPRDLFASARRFTECIKPARAASEFAHKSNPPRLTHLFFYWNRTSLCGTQSGFIAVSIFCWRKMTFLGKTQWDSKKHQHLRWSIEWWILGKRIFLFLIGRVLCDWMCTNHAILSRKSAT